jgi:hypothetical protein
VADRARKPAMQFRALSPCLLFAAVALAGCGDKDLPRTATVSRDGNNTAVLGGYGPGPANERAAPLVDARGQPIPPPPVPSNVTAQTVRSADEGALAVWVQDGHVVASTYTRDKGWSPAQPLETIFGHASDPQLASNGRGAAMAVWRHTVGSIQSLRFSRFEAGAGWSHPDVMPGALPRPDAEGAEGNADAPRLQMDAAGNVMAQWPSGFAANEVQTARYVDGQGWARAESVPVAAAAAASEAAAPASR